MITLLCTYLGIGLCIFCYHAVRAMVQALRGDHTQFDALFSKTSTVVFYTIIAWPKVAFGKTKKTE